MMSGKKMKKKALFTIMLVILFSSFLWPQGIRKAVVAGKFYPGQAEVLSRQIESFLQRTKIKKAEIERITGVIVPHAGYPFSGQVAAEAYRLIQGKDYETIVIIGTSHYYGFRGCSIYLKGGYETPLGIAKIDENLALELSNASGFKYIPQAHRQEHSVEVQVPFIQKVIPQAKIVPIIMGIPEKKTIMTLANALSKVLQGKKVLVIASTDMSHYLHKNKANIIDAKTISLIQSFKTGTLIKKLENRENILCGGGGVVSALLYSQKKGEAKIKPLRYVDSSEFGGPEAQVVGYFTAVIYIENASMRFSLSSEEKATLLNLARSSIELFIKEGKIAEFQTKNPRLLTKKGAFVTLKKGSCLRGCIGFIDPILPLYQTIIQTAIYAASKDARFLPVSPDELNHLDIEISVLSPLKKIDDIETIKVGKHGLLISKGGKKGLLLPQVAIENRWSRKIFLQQTCLKAGLPRNAWKEGADIFILEAIIFH